MYTSSCSTANIEKERKNHALSIECVVENAREVEDLMMGKIVSKEDICRLYTTRNMFYAPFRTSYDIHGDILQKFMRKHDILIRGKSIIPLMN